MATAHVQTKDAQAANATSIGVSLTGVVAGNHLIASTQVGAAGTLTSASAVVPTSTPTATWSNAIPAAADTTGDMAWRTDYSENVASGSWTVTIKSNLSHEVTGLVSESSGVATTLSLGATNSAVTNNVAGTTQATGSITPAAGSILYSTYGDNSGSTTAGTIDSSFLVSSDATAWNGANQRAGIAHKDNVTAAAVNPTWTVPSTNNRHASIIEFFAAAGATDPFPVAYRHYIQRPATRPKLAR